MNESMTDNPSSVTAGADLLPCDQYLVSLPHPDGFPASEKLLLLGVCSTADTYSLDGFGIEEQQLVDACLKGRLLFEGVPASEQALRRLLSRLGTAGVPFECGAYLVTVRDCLGVTKYFVTPMHGCLERWEKLYEESPPRY
jgi:hypothetical protein